MRKFCFFISLIVLFLAMTACNGVDPDDPYSQAEHALDEVIAEIPLQVDTPTIDLPEIHGEYIIVWESDNPGVISIDGTVNRPADDPVTVTLTATTDVPEYDDTVSREVEVTVLPE